MAQHSPKHPSAIRLVEKRIGELSQKGLRFEAFDEASSVLNRQNRGGGVAKAGLHHINSGDRMATHESRDGIELSQLLVLGLDEHGLNKDRGKIDAREICKLYESQQEARVSQLYTPGDSPA